MNLKFSKITSIAYKDFLNLQKKGFFHVLIVVFGIKGLGLVQQVAIARMLSPVELGVIIYILRILSIFGMTSDWGMCTGVLKYASEPICEEEKNRIFKTGLFYSFLSSLSILILYMIYVLISNPVFNSENAPMYLAALIIPFLALEKVSSNYLQSIKKIKLASYISGISGLLSIAFIILGVFYFKTIGFIVGLIFYHCICLTSYLIITREYWYRAQIYKRIITKLLKFGVLSMFGNLIGIVSLSMGVIMIKNLNNDFSQIAIYGIATSIVFGLQLIPQSILRTAFPYFSNHINSPNLLKKKINEVSKKMGLFMIGGVIGIIFFGERIITILYGIKYVESAGILNILIFMLLFWTIGAPFGQLNMILNKVSHNFFIALFMLLLNFFACFLLVPVFKAQGAAYAMALSYFIQTIILIPVALRNVKENEKARNILQPASLTSL